MSRFELWIAGWIDIVVGLIQVLTFGFYRPWWDMSWCAFCAKRKLKV